MRAPTLALVATLAGCIPMVSTFNRVEAPSARYFGSSCYGSTGEPSVVYFPYQEIFLSVDMNPWVRIGVHLPSGTTAEVLSNQVRVSGKTDRGAVDTVMHLKHSHRGSMGTVQPKEFLEFPGEKVSPSNYGPFEGATRNGRHIWYLFVSTDDKGYSSQVPRGLKEGTLELPPMKVNGKRYDGLILPFKRHMSAYLELINC
jgi:hypothetical protein